MSVFYVAQWSIRPRNVAACEQALAVITDHIKVSHTGILSTRVYRQMWGPYPRRAYLWLEEYANLTAMESEPETPKCAEVWQPIEDMALEGTYLCSVWSDPNRSIWIR
jgi:hypothetical protein